MTNKEFLKELCDKCDENSRLTGKANIGCPFRHISNDYCSEYETIKKDIDILEYHKKTEYVVGTFEEGKKELWQEHIRIICDDKTKEIWQVWEGTPEDKAITLDECKKIAKKELGYTGHGTIVVLAESFLDGIIYRFGNYTKEKRWEIAGKMHGFA